MIMSSQAFWPAGARLVLTVSLMFEAGAQKRPDSVYLGPLGDMPPEYPDLPGDTYFEYGWTEAIPRLLDLWDEYEIKVTMFPVGKAIERNVELTKEVVRRGHECAAHGWEWVPQYAMSEEEENEFIRKSVEIVTRVAGKPPRGWNCWGLRGSRKTLELLQSHGLDYHIDDVSRDEPFVRLVNGEPFATVPYTLHNNDLLCYEALGFSTNAYLQQLKDEFDWLYKEAGARRRMMPIACHDRVLGRPARTKAFKAFVEYALGHEGVVFMPRGEIADIVLDEWRNQ